MAGARFRRPTLISTKDGLEDQIDTGKQLREHVREELNYPGSLHLRSAPILELKLDEPRR
jgi:hypothetical protein